MEKKNLKRKISSSSFISPMVLEESKERFNGRLKFYDDEKNFGFIVMDLDKSDIFVII